MKTYKTKSGKTYTKKQICEAIKYWNSVLESLESPVGSIKFPQVKHVDVFDTRAKRKNSADMQYLSAVLPNNPAWNVNSHKNKFQMLIVNDSKLTGNSDYEEALAKGIRAVLGEYVSRFSDNCMFTVAEYRTVNDDDYKNMVRYDELDVKYITAVIRKYRNMSVGGAGTIFVWNPETNEIIDQLSIGEAPWPARNTLNSFEMGNYNGYVIV